MLVRRGDETLDDLGVDVLEAVGRLVQIVERSTASGTRWADGWTPVRRKRCSGCRSIDRERLGRDVVGRAGAESDDDDVACSRSRRRSDQPSGTMPSGRVERAVPRVDVDRRGLAGEVEPDLRRRQDPGPIRRRQIVERPEHGSRGSRTATRPGRPGRRSRRRARPRRTRGCTGRRSRRSVAHGRLPPFSAVESIENSAATVGEVVAGVEAIEHLVRRRPRPRRGREPGRRCSTAGTELVARPDLVVD